MPPPMAAASLRRGPDAAEGTGTARAWSPAGRGDVRSPRRSGGAARLGLLGPRGPEQPLLRPRPGEQPCVAATLGLPSPGAGGGGQRRLGEVGHLASPQALWARVVALRPASGPCWPARPPGPAPCTPHPVSSPQTYVEGAHSGESHGSLSSSPFLGPGLGGECRGARPPHPARPRGAGSALGAFGCSPEWMEGVGGPSRVPCRWWTRAPRDSVAIAAH